jgi:DNA-binding PadR family transcriptional regulator
MADVRLSQAALKVLKYFLQDVGTPRSGAELSTATQVGSGTLYPMLARLEVAGWLTSEWEGIDPSVARRPRRRFYKLTGRGQTSASKALGELQVQVVPGKLAPGELAWKS